MKKFLFALFFFLLTIYWGSGQTISVRVREVSFSSVDPDGAGPAAGSIVFRFELKSSGASVLADGMGLSVVYQSAKLMATPANTTVKLGPINTALWAQGADNRSGNVITPVTYGTRTFDRRMIVSFNQNAGMPDASISGTTWTPVAQITYYTLGTGSPEGGYITPEPATTVAQNELSSDGGLTTYPYLSPEVNVPVSLSAVNAPLPVLFIRFDVQCSSGKSTTIGWSTTEETNSQYFELEKSRDGLRWNILARISAAGNSTVQKDYRTTDAEGGKAYYRLKQIDRDGRTTYSAIVKADCESRNDDAVLYPVPARDVVNLILHAPVSGKLLLQLYDVRGILIMNLPTIVIRGINTVELDVRKLAAGEYVLKSTNGVDISKRFAIAR